MHALAKRGALLYRRRMTDQQVTESNNQTHAHKTAKAVSIGALLRLLRYPFVLLSFALIPRLMEDGPYGRYAYYLTVFLLLDIFSDIGFIQVFGRCVPEFLAEGRRDKAQALLHQSLTFGLLLTGALIAILYSVSSLMPNLGLPAKWLILLSLQLLFTQIEGILFSYSYGRNEIERYSFKEILRSAFNFVLVLGGFLKWGLDGALVGLVISEALLCIVAIHWTANDLFVPWKNISLTKYWPFLLLGFHFYIPASLLGVLQRAGGVFVKQITGIDAEISCYDLANQLFLLFSTFLMLTLSSLIPALTELHLKKDHEGLIIWQKRAMTACASLAVLGWLGLAWTGDVLLPLILGNDFVDIMPATLVAFTALIPFLIASIGMNYAVILKEPKIYTYSVAAGVAVMIPTCLLLIPAHGALGAAWAASIGYAIMALIFFLHYRSDFLRICATLPRILLAGGLAALLLLTQPQGLLYLLITAALSAIIFIAGLFALRVITKNELLLLRKAFQHKEDNIEKNPTEIPDSAAGGKNEEEDRDK